MKAGTLLLWIQGVYFTLTGIWPLVHLSSFIWVTGPKHDIWLLKTVSVIIALIGLSYLVAAYKKEVNFSVLTLSLMAPLGLLVIDIYYATADIIADIYLLDAAAEAVFISIWVGLISTGKWK